MAAFKFSQKSLDKLVGVHPDLVAVVKRALELSSIDFTVLEGLRDPGKQKEIVKKGKSWTKNSRHFTGHAVNVGVIIDRHVIWDYPWYERLYRFFQQASDELKIPIEWGGHWEEKDGGHYELTWKNYPLK